MVKRMLPALVAGLLLVSPAAADNGKGKKPDADLYATPTVTELVASGRLSPEASIALEAEGSIMAYYPACYWATWKSSRGLWPLSRSIYQQTNWCSNGSYITYRSTSQWPDTGWSCSVNWGPASWLTSGGNGHQVTTVMTRGGFSCGPIPNLGFLNDWLDIHAAYTSWGSTYRV